MRTANPALNENTFRKFFADAGAPVMTIQGTVNKTGLLLFICAGCALLTWIPMHSGEPVTAGLLALGGFVGGLVFGLTTAFKPAWAPVTAPLYAASEGLLLGAISAVYDLEYPGKPIVLHAVLLTFGTLFALLAAYSTRLIRPSENFKLGVVAATGGIMLVYLASFVLGLFHIRLPFIHDSGPVGIVFSLVVVTIAALNLVLDFDFIESGADSRAPKFMEWYSAYGLLVTLVWLYLEILRLLAKLNRRR